MARNPRYTVLRFHGGPAGGPVDNARYELIGADIAAPSRVAAISVALDAKYPNRPPHVGDVDYLVFLSEHCYWLTRHTKLEEAESFTLKEGGPSGRPAISDDSGNDE